MDYPISKDTPDSLYRVSNSATSVLIADVTGADLIIPVLSAVAYPDGRFILTIESELIIVSAKDIATQTLIVEQRGAFGSAAVPHLATARANGNITAQHYEALRDTIIGHQDQLWFYRHPIEGILVAPPLTPVVNGYYVVDDDATGDWLGQDSNIALESNGAWVFITPEIGFFLFDKTAGNTLTYTVRGWSRGSAGNIPTDIIVADYSAEINELVRCDTTLDPFTVTLPLAPEDGDTVAILDVAGFFAIHNLTIVAGDITHNIQGDLSPVALNINGGYVNLLWVEATQDWRLLETPNFIPVLSVFGRAGPVVAMQDDYTADLVRAVPVVQSPETNYGSASPVDIGVVIADRRVISVTVVVSQVWDGAGATVTIGTDLAPSLLVSGDDIDITTLGTYEIYLNHITTIDEHFKIFITPGMLGTTGQIFASLRTGGFNG